MALLDDIQEKVKVQPKKTSSDSTAQEQSSPASFQLKVGRTVTGLPGTPANVAVTGSQFQPTLNFVIPEGVQGDTGVPGAPGSSVNVLGELDNVSELPEGASQGDAYTIDGDLWVWTDDNDGAWNNAGPFRGPQGVPGLAATIDVGTVSTGAPGSNAVVQNAGNTSSAIFNFTIPRGEQGIQGPQGPSIWGGISGNIATQTDLLTLFNTKSDNSAVVHLTGTQTISGSKTFTAAETLFHRAIVVQAANSTTQSNLFLKDDTGATQGLLHWERSTDTIKLVRYDAAGTGAEGSLALTSTNLTWNGANVWHTGNLDPNGFASNASVVLVTTDQTVAGVKSFSNNVIVESGGVYSDAIAGQNAHFWLRNESNTPQGLLYWDRSADSIILRRYDVAGSGIEGQVTIAATGFTFSSNAIVSGALFTAKQGRFDRGGAAADATNDLSVGNGTHDIRIHSRLTAGSYNSVVLADDKGIIYTNGTQTTGGFVIAPWSENGDGVRFTVGSTTFKNQIVNFFSSGAVGTQQIFRAMGWNNSIARWKEVIETDATYSIYGYDTAGNTPTVGLQIKTTVAGGSALVVVPGVLVAGDGNGTESVRVGNDSSLWDVNIANTMGLKGIANQSLGYLKFGADPGSLGWDGTYLQYSGAALAFGATTRQMINLWQTTYGIGVQGNTLFQRTGNRFSWFKGGSFSVTENDPGTGGTVHMTLDGSGNLSVAGALTIGLTFTQSAGEAYFSSWIRSNTSGTGWYHQVHGGGWYMTDSSWIRSYGSKPVLITLADGTFLRGETTSPTIEFYDTDQATTHWLHCNSNQFGFLQNNAFAWGAYRDPSNNWGCVGNVIAYASDRRLKTNVIDVPKSIVDNFFDKVRIRVFDWDAQKLALHKIGFEAKTEQVGAIAQEMREAFADAVVVNTAHNPIPTDNNPNPEKPDFLTIDWTKVVPLLVAEVQSLRARVSFLEAK